MWYDVMLVEKKCGGAVMTETEKRMYRVCFMGHRPEKLIRNEKSSQERSEKKKSARVIAVFNGEKSGTKNAQPHLLRHKLPLPRQVYENGHAFLPR